MGTKQTALARIKKIRSVVAQSTADGKKVNKKKLIGMLILEGSTRRTAESVIQAFVDSEEFEEEIINDIYVLSYIRKNEQITTNQIQ